MPTLKDRVFLELALREGLFQPEKLDQITTTQVELENFGISKFVGALLVEKGLAPKEEVGGIIELLGDYLVRCGSCGTENPVSSCDRQGNLRCTRCSEAIAVPEGRLSEEQFFEGTPKGEGQRKHSRGSRESAGRKQGCRSRRDPLAAKSFVYPSRSSPAGPPEVTRFHVQALAGISASGSLYRIIDNSNFGALKIIEPALYANRGVFKGWVDVMQKVQDLPRSATLKPTQLVRDGSLHYVVRPYVEPDHCSLRAWLTARAETSAKPSSFSTRQALGISVAMLNSLSAFHSVRLVHGNLRPENVLLDRDAVLLTDPGILLLFGGLEPEERLLRLWESRRYLAPEVLQGGEPTFASDVYAAGRIVEDLMERSAPDGTAQSEGGKENEVRKRLIDLAGSMVAFDPAERPPTAKEVLREIQSPDATQSGDGLRSRRSSVVVRRRSERVRAFDLSPGHLVGPALLLLALGWLGWLAWTWNVDRGRLRSGAYADELTADLFRQETEALVQATVRNRTSLPVAEERWNGIVEIYRGTQLEAEARQASKRTLTLLTEPSDESARRSVEKAESQAQKGQWIPALVTLLRCQDRLHNTSLWGRQFEKVTKGLRESVGLIYVPGGTVTLFIQGQERPFEVSPFLIDAEPVSRQVGERALQVAGQELEADPADATHPWVNIGLAQARKASAALNRRVPTLAEWTRFAEETGRHLIPSLDGPQASGFAPQCTLFEWTEEVHGDSLSKLGYGFCVGGARHGVSPTHPVRRKVSYGYPDVGVRFVQDLDLSGKK